MPRIFALILAAALGVAAASAGSARAASVADFYDLAKPGGNGPFPAALLVPGCTGMDGQSEQPVYDRYRKRLLADGFVVANINFLKTYQIGACNQGGKIFSKVQVAKDVLTGIADLKKSAFVDPAGVHLVGWSYGGGVALQALSLAEQQPDANIKSVVVYYPGCGGISAWTKPVPVLALTAGADDVAPFAYCKDAARAALANGSLRVIEYPGVYHAFDYFTVAKPSKYGNGIVGYDANAAAKAWTEAEAFLKQ